VAAYHSAELTADVLGLADLVGAERFHVVGHDWGALVAWSLAGSTPERLHTLTALSVPHPAAFADARANDPDQRQKSAYIPHLRAPGSEAMFLADDGSVELRFAEVSPRALAHHSRILSSPGALTAALNYYRAWDSALDRTPTVTVPTLFVWSTDDVALGRTGAEATARHVDAPYRFEVIDGESHWLPEVVPDRIAELLLDHFATYG
jgi:pimeloyl-ACP methyl ester carboxylesterase